MFPYDMHSDTFQPSVSVLDFCGSLLTKIKFSLLPTNYDYNRRDKCFLKHKCCVINNTVMAKTADLAGFQQTVMNSHQKDGNGYQSWLCPPKTESWMEGKTVHNTTGIKCSFAGTVQQFRSINELWLFRFLFLICIFVFHCLLLSYIKQFVL